MKLLHTFFLLFFVQILFGQKTITSKLSLLQGVWECNFASGMVENTDEQGFTIVNEHNSINFVFSNDTELNFPLGESMKGFHDFNIDSISLDSININSLKENGLYYTIINKNDIHKNGWGYTSDYVTPLYYDCDGDHLSICGGKLVEYSKISKLPLVALTKLYYRGKQDNRDYIKEYLSIEVVAITIPQSLIYSKPKQATTNFLNQGDVVTILAKKGDWLKVDYGGEQEGWIKKSAVMEKSK